MAHGTPVMLASIAVFIWCLIGTTLLNHLPLLSDPRLYASLRRTILSHPLLIAIVLVTLWPARKMICAWLTQRSHR